MSFQFPCITRLLLSCTQLCFLGLTLVSVHNAAAATPSVDDVGKLAAEGFKQSEDQPESPEARQAKMAWLKEAKFGMFIHWGLYSIPAGTFEGRQIPHSSEWMMNYAKVPVARYAQFAKEFNPTRFNAEEWVKLAKNAGMKYIVITTKHHEGFAMYATKASPFNIMEASPFKRDVIAELAEACRKEGIKLGFYYSQGMDWHHPGSKALFNGNWDPAQDGDTDAYIDKLVIPQVRELLKNYGEFPAVLWWDGASSKTGITKARAERIYKTVKELRPDVIMNNRLGGGFKGDTETPEQTIPDGGFPDGRAWESCMTMNGSWGYKPGSRWKDASELIFNLVDIASKGGNYLLNVGPTAEGVFPPEAIERLATVGNWMQVNGEAIRGTSPTCFGVEYGPDNRDAKGRRKSVEKAWRCTTKPGKIFIHFFQWPTGKFEVAGVKGTVSKAVLMADPERKPLAFTQSGDKLSVTLPPTAPDPIASVLCLEYAAH